MRPSTFTAVISLGAVSLLFLCPNPVTAQKWDTLAPVPERFTFPVVDTANGRIHIMGGGGTGGATDRHLAYDPATNTWDTLAPIPYRAQQPAGATAQGKIHFFGGGFPNTGTPLADHYIFDPDSNSWTQAADLTTARAIHYAVTLDSVLYSLAGQGVANLCQAYDAESNAWITKQNLPDNQFWYGAHVGTGGHIYRFCGGGYTAPNKNAHRYDPDTDDWNSIPNFPNATHALRGAAIGNKIYLAGGYFDFLERDEVWIFDTETQEYTAGVPLPIGRNYHNMVALDSCIYVVGGNHALDETVSTQLIRFCPYETTSATKSATLAGPLEVWYDAENIVVELPQDIQYSGIKVFDVVGNLIFTRGLSDISDPQYVIPVAHYPAAIYFVQVYSAQQLRVGKVIVQHN
jgi:hypothetical protein